MANPITIVTLTATLPEIPDFPKLESPNFEAEVKATCDGIDEMEDVINGEFKTQLNNIIAQINQNITWMNENLAVFVQVGNDITKVITVADNITKVITVADNIANITTVANSIDNVNAVGADITKVTTVADNIQAILNLEAIRDKIVSVEEIKGQIQSVGDNISKVVLVADNIDNINTLIQHLDNINTLAVQADNIDTIATNIAALLDLSNNITTLINAKNETLAAKDTALQARDEAITAKNTAVEAKNIVINAVLYKGVWDNSATYNKDEITRYGNKFYVSLQDNNTNKQPDTETDFWVELASGGANYPDMTGKAGYFLAVKENEQEVEWKSLILPAPQAQINWNMDEETTIEIPIANYNPDFSYVLDVEIGNAYVNSEGKIVYSPGNVPDTKNYYIKVKATKRGFFDSDWLTILVNINNLQLPTPQLSTIDSISHLEQAVFDILNFDSSYTYNIENEQNGTVAVDMQNGKIIFTPTLQTTTPVTGGFSVYASKSGETPSDSLSVSFEIYIPKLETPEITGDTAKNWNEPFNFTITNYDSNNNYIFSNVIGGSVSRNGENITFTADPVSSNVVGSFEVKAVKENYLDSDSTSKSFTITVPKLEAPVLSGAAEVNEDTSLEITITNYDSANTYIISKGTQNGDTITYLTPNVDTDTADSITVKATRENWQDSDESIFNFTIKNVPIVADNAVQIVDFTALETSTNAEIQNGDIVATADNAAASVLSPTQESEETDWVKYRNIAKYILPEIPLLDSSTNTEIQTEQEITGTQNIAVYADSTIHETSADFAQDVISSVNDVDPFKDGSGVALWQFEGNANDTGGNYNGSWSGNEQYDTGKYGQGAKLDGSSTIKFMNDLNLQNYTITLWVKLSSTGQNNKRILEAYNSNGKSCIFEIVNNKVYFGLNNGGTTNTTSFASISDNLTDKFYFLALTSDSKAYKDKVLIDNNDTSDSRSADREFVGTDYDGSGAYAFAGIIDQVRIFNRALTAEEVAKLYNEEKTIFKADISNLNLTNAPTKAYFNALPTFATKTNTEEITQDIDTKNYDNNTEEFECIYATKQPTDTFRQLEYKWSNIKKDTKITEIKTDLWKEG